jgi:Tripartite tricarboxylate transporter TctB family
MNDRGLLQSLLLIVIALVFGLQAVRYPIGRLEQPGPGLFPLIVSSLLFLIGVAALVRSRFGERAPMSFDVKNIALITASLVGFALLSQFVNMIVAIVFMVFCSAFAAEPYSVMRNVKISAGLIAIAFAFQKFLGLSLPLY